MDFSILRTGIQDIHGDGSDVSADYLVKENGREFRITCRTQPYPQGRSVKLAGKEGLLYVDSDDNRVHRQVLVPGGGCGLRILDEEVVEGLSPVALRSVIAAYTSTDATESCDKP